MQIQKKVKICGILGVSIFLSTVNIPALGFFEVSEYQDKVFEINQPLSEWPKIYLSSSEEIRCYDLAWNVNKSLEENQRELVKNFISSCCDFSFKLDDLGLSGIYPGKFDDGESIIFIDKETRMSINHSSNNVVFSNERDGIRGLEVLPRTALLPNIKPIKFQEWMKYELERYIQRIVEDPVGCEILRMSIAKYKAGERRLSKIRFLPQDDPKVDLAYTPGSYVWKHARRIGRSDFGRYAQFCRENKFILFSPEWFNTDQRGLILKLDKTESGTDDFEVNTGIIPREASLVYQIIYSIHLGKATDYGGTQVIEQRDDQSYFCGNFEGVGPFSILKKRLNVSIFKNDKIYRAMYGLTRRGFDLISESSYLAHRYALIRPAYTGFQAGIVVNEKKLNNEESRVFLKRFLKTSGDFDLYGYLLSRRSLSADYPEFGKGNYRCSDIDSEKETAIR